MAEFYGLPPEENIPEESPAPGPVQVGMWKNSAENEWVHFNADGTGTDRTILSGIHAFYEPEELVGKTLVAITNLPPRPMMGIDSCGMLISAAHTEEGEQKLNLIIVSDRIPAGAKLC